jgi:hypothetical protein
MGIGSPENPYVENPYAGRIVNVHWSDEGGSELSGTCVGDFVFTIGSGGFSMQVGLVDPDTGIIYAQTDISVPEGGTQSVTVSASGTLTGSNSIGIGPWFNVVADSTLGMSGIFYLDHPPGTAFRGGPISNTGDLNPYSQFVLFPGGGKWSATLTATAKAFGLSASQSGIGGIVEGVLTQ